MVHLLILRATDLIAFANGTSKWNSKIPSSSSAINPDRIFRFIEQTKNGKRVHNNDLVSAVSILSMEDRSMLLAMCS